MWECRARAERKVVVAGVAAPELTALEIWAARRELELAPVEFDEPLTLDELGSAALAVFDARREPLLAMVECARLNARQRSVPSIVFGAAEMERAALRAGASVYLACPLTLDRLLGYADRLVAPTRQVAANQLLALGQHVALDLNGSCLLVNGSVQRLTPDRFRLLSYFVANPERIITAEELVSQGLLLPRQSARFRAVICELRKQLGMAADCIQLVRGYGYRFEAPVTNARLQGPQTELHASVAPAHVTDACLAPEAAET